ncbi:hypothetical protein [Mycoplasma hafezii]|uniref:hypothetical protein n=1 Tax=Mycoplasma hafezii TaxID=525886 RepID=UPI003CFAAA83
MSKKFRNILLTTTITSSVLTPSIVMVSASSDNSNEWNPTTMDEAQDDIKKVLNEYEEQEIFNSSTIINLTNYFKKITDLDEIKRDYPQLLNWANNLKKLKEANRELTTLGNNWSFAHATLEQRKQLEASLNTMGEIITHYKKDNNCFPDPLEGESFISFVSKEIENITNAVGTANEISASMPRPYRDWALEALKTKWKFLTNEQREKFISLLEKLPESALREQVDDIIQQAINAAEENLIEQVNNSETIFEVKDKNQDGSSEHITKHLKNPFYEPQKEFQIEWIKKQFANIAIKEVFNAYDSKDIKFIYEETALNASAFQFRIDVIMNDSINNKVNTLNNYLTKEQREYYLDQIKKVGNFGNYSLNDMLGVNKEMKKAKKAYEKYTQELIDSEKYLYSTNKAEFDKAEQKLNELIHKPGVTRKEIQDAVKEFDKQYQELNGKSKLEYQKDSSNSKIDNLEYLSLTVKSDIKNQINSATDINTVTRIESQATNLNYAVGELVAQLPIANNVKNTDDYKFATTENKRTFNNALISANGILAPEKNQLLNLEDDNITGTTEKVKKIVSDLKVLDGIAQKQKIQSSIEKLDLTNGQKEYFKTELNNAADLTAAEGVLNNAKTLVEPTKQLKSKLKTLEDAKSTPNYKLANTEKQKEYDQALTDAQAKLDKSPSELVSVTIINQLIQDLDTANTNLDGLTNLKNAQDEINKQSNLTQKGKDAYLKKLQNKNSKAELDQVVAEAQQINKWIPTAQQKLDTANANKNSINYQKATPENKTALDTALDNQTNFINEIKDGETFAQKDAAQILENTENAIKNLDGFKNALNDFIKNTLYLSDTSKLKLLNKVLKEKALNQTKYQSLFEEIFNTAKSDFEVALDKREYLNNQNKIDILNSVKTAQANQTNPIDQALQTILNQYQPLEQARKTIKTALTPVEMPTEIKDNIFKTAMNDDTVTDVQKINDIIPKIVDTLSTSKQLQARAEKLQAKDEYTKYLPDADKQALADAINDDNTAITSLKSDSFKESAELEKANTPLSDNNTTLETKLNELDQTIKNITQALNQIDNTKYLTNEQKENLKSQIKTIDFKKPNWLKNWQNKILRESYKTVESKINEAKLTDEIKADLIKDAQKVVVVNEEGKAIDSGFDNILSILSKLEAISNLKNLTNAQKIEFKKQIQAETNPAKQDAIIEQANTLDSIMQKLNTEIKDKDNVITTSDYKLSDTDKQTAYTDSVTAAQAKIDDTQKVLLETGTAQTLLEEIINAKKALNGNGLIEAAKAEIDKLTNISNSQKDAFKGELDKVKSKGEISSIVDSAKSLDEIIKKAKDKLAEVNKAKQENNYINADSDKKDALDQSVAQLQNALNDLQNKNVTSKQVVGIIKDLTDKIDDTTEKLAALNGDLKLIKDAIDASKLLSDAQKEAAKADIDALKPFTLEAAIELLNNDLETSRTIATEKLNKLQNLTKEQKDKFLQQIKSALLTLEHGSAFDKKISEILDKAIAQNKSSDELVNGVDNLGNLTNPEKDQVKDDIKESETKDEAVNSFNNAQKLNELIDKLIKDIQNYLATENRVQVEKDVAELTQLAIKSKDNEIITPVPEVDNLVDFADVIWAIRHSGKYYLGSNVNNDDFETKLNNLNNSLSKGTNLLATPKSPKLTPKLSDLYDKLSSELQTTINLHQEFPKLIDAIKNKKSLETQLTLKQIKFIDDINQWAPILEEFLYRSDYFNKVSSSSTTSSDFAQLKEQINQMSDLPEVVKTALLYNCELTHDKLNVWWWIVIVLATLGTAGIIWGFIAAKRKKDKEKDK